MTRLKTTGNKSEEQQPASGVPLANMFTGGVCTPPETYATKRIKLWSRYQTSKD